MTNPTTFAPTTNTADLPARWSRVSFTDRGVRRAGVVSAFNYYFEKCDALYVDTDGGAISVLVWLATQDVRPA
jgi:hypothetical protein